MNRQLVAAAALLAALAAAAAPALAIPIFAQRYDMKCASCHSVLPELNAFGNAFRDRGYRLPPAVARHGTTIVALRHQTEYDREPAPGARRFTPAGILLAQAEIGQVEAFLHYNLGSGGGPSAPYLAYLATYDAKSALLVRAGLVELPLAHSPAQRNDTLTTYGYEGQRVGLNDLLLAQPRLGLEAERNVGAVRLAGTFAIGEYQGAAYGGKPIATGESSRPDRPEIGLYARTELAPWLGIGADTLAGARRISPDGRAAFVDPYTRTGAFIEAHRGRFDLLAQQWLGHDGNADGAGGSIASYGGYARLRYAPSPHAFIGARYDTAAASAATRAITYYAETQLVFARILIQDRRLIGGGADQFTAAFTFGAPGARGR